MNKLTKIGWGQAAAVVTIASGIFMLVTWVVWLLWCSVMPYFWVSGPSEFTDPEYLKFAGVILLGHMVISLLGLKK